MMRVSLLSSPFVVPDPHSFHSVAPPLGLLYIASMLRGAGHEVSIIDLIAEAPHEKVELTPGINRYGLGDDKVIHALEEQAPDLIGLSVMFVNSLDASVTLLNRISEAFPATVLVTGGHGATVACDSLFRHAKGMDALVLGEGEEILLHWLGGGVKKSGLGSHPSVMTRDSWREGRAHENAVVEEIDALPMPSHELVLGKYDNYSAYPICTSRGCPYQCVFCSVHTLCGRRWRARNVTGLLAEIRYLVETFDVDSFYITDDNFTLDPDRVMDLCLKLGKLGRRIRWNCLSGVNPENLTRQVLKQMKAAGCEALSLAVESASKPMLARMGKRISLDKVRQVVEWCRELGLFVNGMFIIGIPGETRETVEESIRFALGLPFDGVSVAIATPFPGTRLYDECVRKGFLVERDIGNYNLRESLIQTPQLSAEELKALQVHFLRTYEERYRGRVPYESVKKYMRNPNRASWEAIAPYL